jgi:hypothetical protein
MDLTNAVHSELIPLFRHFSAQTAAAKEEVIALTHFIPVTSMPYEQIHSLNPSWDPLWNLHCQHARENHGRLDTIR